MKPKQIQEVKPSKSEFQKKMHLWTPITKVLPVHPTDLNLTQEEHLSIGNLQAQKEGKSPIKERGNTKKERKFPIKRGRESKKKKKKEGEERKSPIKGSEENRTNMQKGLQTRRYMNIADLLPRKHEKKGNHDLKWSSLFDWQPKSCASVTCSPRDKQKKEKR